MVNCLLADEIDNPDVDLRHKMAKHKKKSSDPNHLRTLIVDASYQPIRICPSMRAFLLLMRDAGELVESWDTDLAPGIPTPAVIRLKRTGAGVWLRAKRTKFRREVVFTRDSWTCQYCMCHVSNSSATIDHVIPRKHGGETSWLNCVTCCLTCNSKKGSKLGMMPLRRPAIPDPLHFHGARGIKCHPAWKDYVAENVLKAVCGITTAQTD